MSLDADWIYIYIYIYIYQPHIYIYIFTNPGYDTRSIFERSLTGLNSEFSFSLTSCLTKAEEPGLRYYFTHSWRENNWIHTFPKDMSGIIWNQSRVAVSISYDDKHYTTGTWYIYIYIYIYIYLYTPLCCVCACVWVNDL